MKMSIDKSLILLCLCSSRNHQDHRDSSVDIMYVNLHCQGMLINLILYYALGHSKRGSVTYAGVDMATGEMVAIIEWAFKLKPKNTKNMTSHDPDSESSSDITDYMKQVNILQFFLCIGLLHYCV